MSSLKGLSIALAVLAGTGLLLGTFGFSAASAERGVSVAVVDDENAMVGYQASDRLAPEGQRVDLVTVTNRLSSEASVTNVTVTTSGDDDNVVVSNVSKPTLGPGEAEAVAADVHCPGNRDVPITVSVTVEAEGVTAAISGDTTTRSFSLDCGGEGESSGPRFTGAGNFEFGATDAETVNVTYWSPSEQSSDASFDEWGPAEVKTWKKLNGQVDNGPKFVAVYVHEWDTTYVHPGFDRANGTVDWGTGDAVVEDGRFDPTSD
jgi:hypothetical protein